MSLVDKLDPARLLGFEAPEEVPTRAMREIEKGRSHLSGIFRYSYEAGKIVRENWVTGKGCVFYELDGKQCFYN